MKKKIFIGIGLVLIAIVGYFGYAVMFPKSPGETATFQEGDISFSVKYSRPFKRGRVIFGEAAEGALQPYGKYWRLGANAPTEITFNKDVTFAGKPISAGTYRMYAVPGATSFSIFLNSEVGSFSGAGEPDHAKDLLTVEVPVTATPSLEQFTISFNKEGETINLDMNWDEVLLRVPLTIQ